MDCSQDISKDSSLVKTGASASTVNGLLLWLLARGLSSLLTVAQKPHHRSLSIGLFECPDEMAAGFFQKKRRERRTERGRGGKERET